MSDYSNDLIYGKNKIERITACEADGENFVLFRELEDGSVNSITLPASYWFITNKSISAKEYELEGNQYFKYYHEFSSLEKAREVQSKLWKKRIDYYSIWDAKEANLVVNGITYYKGMQLKDVGVLSFDIESEGLTKTKNSEVYIITNTFRKGDVVTRKAFFLDEYKTQGDMLTAWCNWVREINPSLVIGHNIYSYDLPYLDHVARLHKVELNLGRNNSELKFNTKSSQFRKDGSQSYEYYKAFIYGRELVDTMFLAIKYDVGRKYESYGLKSIIKHEGLEKQGRTFIDAGRIKHIYKDRLTNPEMWEKAKQYAIEDSDDSLKLFDLMAPSFFYMAQSISKTFQEINTGATGSQLNNMMVRAYLQDGHSIARADEAVPYEGAISFGISGIYRNCFKQDVASLYPSIMRQYKVYDAKKDPKKYFLELVETFTLERLKNKKIAKETKNKYYTDLEQSGKIFINSAYGFLGASGLNYNSPSKAGFITEKGREILEKAVIFATGQNVDFWKTKAIGKEDDNNNDTTGNISN